MNIDQSYWNAIINQNFGIFIWLNIDHRLLSIMIELWIE